MINLDFMASVLARVGGAGSLYIALQAIKLKFQVKNKISTVHSSEKCLTATLTLDETNFFVLTT